MLLEKSLRVITVDNRDAGLSEHFSHLKTSISVPAAIGRTLLRLPVQAPYLLEDMALDLVQLLDELKLQRAHVVGASMGGMIGQNLDALERSLHRRREREASGKSIYDSEKPELRIHRSGKT